MDGEIGDIALQKKHYKRQRENPRKASAQTRETRGNPPRAEPPEREPGAKLTETRLAQSRPNASLARKFRYRFFTSLIIYS